MGNALRLLIFCLALAAVGLSAAIGELWLKRRAHQRLQNAQESAHLIKPVLAAHQGDQQKITLLLVVVSFSSLVAIALAANRRPINSSLSEEIGRSRGEMKQVERLARTAVATEEALCYERAERRRADENARLHQLLLDQAISDKIRLGRDLHDGVIQSLYATGLTLESSRQKRPSDVAGADALFERGMQMLNGTIRDIRAYIHSLSDSQAPVRRDFSNALSAILNTLKGERPVEFAVRIDEAAEARMGATQIPDVLQIIQEAVSNALRHGDASRIDIRLHQDDDHLALLVQDNGRGFDTVLSKPGGHGLANLKARSGLLGAELRLDSKPGQGTRLAITFPVTTTRP
jgi:signal transduction histidine kinase